MRIADRLRQAGNEHDAQAVIRISQAMQAGKDRLVGYEDEVKAGRVERHEAELSAIKTTLPH